MLSSAPPPPTPTQLPLSAPPPCDPEPLQLESKLNSLDSEFPSESEPLPLSAPSPSDPEPPQLELKEKSLDSSSVESDCEASDGESIDFETVDPLLEGPGITVHGGGDYNMDHMYCVHNFDEGGVKLVDKAIWERYFQQIDESEGFDIKDFPGHGPMTIIVPSLAVSRSVIECAAEAVKSYNEKNGSNYELNEVLKVNGRLSEVCTYYITFTVTNDDKKCEYFQAKVLRFMNKSMEVLIVRRRAKEGLDV